jgi:XrtJ-associated TM-motif-TM protein
MALAFFVVAVFLFAATIKRAYGQSGCVDSPEDPTLVMAGLGIAAAAAPFAWSRIRNRRREYEGWPRQLYFAFHPDR